VTHSLAARGCSENTFVESVRFAGCGAGWQRWQPAAGCLTRLQALAIADERRLPTGAQDIILPHKRVFSSLGVSEPLMDSSVLEA
jgi:hypothetical protein